MMKFAVIKCEGDCEYEEFMRKLLLLAFALFFTFSLHAQNKVQFSLGTGVSVDFQNTIQSYYNSTNSVSTISFSLGVFNL